MIIIGAVTAAEAHILLKGVHATGRDAFRLAIAELVVRRNATLGSTKERVFLMLKRRRPVLAVTGTAPTDPVLRSVWDAIAAAQEGSRPAPAPNVAREAWLIWGDLDHWGRKVAAQALIDRGLLEVHRRSSWFGFRVAESLTPTAAGAEALRRLQEQLALLRATGRPVEERAQALAALGATALLAREAWLEMQRLREVRGYDPGEGGGGGGTEDLDFGVLAGIDIGDFDSFGEAFDALGDSVESGGGDGDGDGGDGD